MDEATKLLLKEGKMTQRLLQDIVYKTKQEKARDIFEEIEKEGIMFNIDGKRRMTDFLLSKHRFEKLKKRHLEGEGK